VRRNKKNFQKTYFDTLLTRSMVGYKVTAGSFSFPNKKKALPQLNYTAYLITIRASMATDIYGTDLQLVVKRNQKGELYADIDINREGDFTTISGKDNVIQAIRNRLATRKGELAELGHPEYGSLLEDMVGEANTEDTRRIIETLVHEALKYEPRIESILTVSAVEGGKDRVDITIRVRLRETSEILTAEYPFYLESI
jgi:phage baseplate assembly protein W